MPRRDSSQRHAPLVETVQGPGSLIVLLIALTMLVAPLAPVAAQGPQGPPGDAGPPQDEGAYEGDHVTATINEDVPGLENVTLDTDDPLLVEVSLPQSGDEITTRANVNQLTLLTDHATLTIRDQPGTPATLNASDTEPIQITTPANANLTHTNDTILLESDSATLEISGENLTLDGDQILIHGDATWETTHQTDDDAQQQDRRGPPSSPSERAQQAQNDRDREPGPPADRPATWQRPAMGPPGAQELPHHVDARYFAFTLDADGMHNLTVHDETLGTIGFDSNIDTLRQIGVSVQAHGNDTRILAVDAPATQIHIQAPNLTHALPTNTTLPSGASLTTDHNATEDTLHIHVHRPMDAVPASSPADHRPAHALERVDGPPGLTAKSDRANMSVASEYPQHINSTFDGEINGTQGNISLGLTLERALLIEDTPRTGQVNIGDPAIAEQALNNGTTHVEDDRVINHFDLWSGTLEVILEPGEDTVKITYQATNLSAPPNTLFVLEAKTQAPPGANLTPTANGVIVDNGSLQAEYSLAGPVIVDGHEAWADRSIHINSDDQVRILVAYPAGDNITHDPTVSVQSAPGVETLTRLAASPYAIAVGALGAIALVGITAWNRRG